MITSPGYNEKETKSNYIPNLIRKIISKQPCANCFTTSNIECDHRNSLITPLLNPIIDDFQPLCKHCNDRKRETMNLRKNNKRYGAKEMGYPVDFIYGTDKLDNMAGMIGTFWYDPI